MKHLSLANKYRPQAFGEVVGQSLATSALSHAAARDKVAPAYLLSGTRGVGKTTIARIFAKALNCEHAPAAEPCNSCPQCAQITSGNHVDVCEIDGASNTGVDDVRALRENVGYMPMQGRYKIFIMDEAHMLSKSAFNALLKTLEEPPAHTVFIFATTEAHRFPATIVSRCQHFVFRHLSEDALYGHLLNILEKEGLAYEQGAIRLIARRAAGSVRDSLSLLDQTVALAQDRPLDIEIVRQSLGLAGQEFFTELFGALPDRDCAKVVRLAGELLHSGVDIGFFLRELGNAWRNLFLYREAGEKILPQLQLAPDELDFVKKNAPAFNATQLHAAWQMTLENQKSIAQNAEPGAALELLLLNLALLPRLLPVAKLPESAQAAGNEAGRPDLDEPARSYATANRATAKKSAPAGETAAPARARPDAGRAEADPWQAFCRFCADGPAAESMPRDILRAMKVNWQDDSLEISFPSEVHVTRFNPKRDLFEKLLGDFCGGKPPRILYREPKQHRSQQELLDECRERPELKLCQEILGAELRDCQPKKS